MFWWRNSISHPPNWHIFFIHMLLKKQLCPALNKKVSINKCFSGYDLWLVLQCFSFPNNSFQASSFLKNYVMSLIYARKIARVWIWHHIHGESLEEILRTQFTAIQKVRELILQANIWNWLAREPWMPGQLMCVHSKCACAHTSNKPFHKTENIVSPWFYNCLFRKNFATLPGYTYRLP